MTHTRIGDLNATLSSPGGTVFPLFIRVGKTSSTGVGDLTNLSGDYRFTDRARDSLWVMALVLGTNVAMPSGDYRTSGALSGDSTSLNRALAGQECNGNWSLRISDNAGGEIGSLRGWELAIVVPGPGVLGLVGAGGLVATRRRR